MPSYALFKRLPVAMCSLHHFEAHGPRRADEHLAGAVEVLGVEIDHLLLRDFADLLHRDLADRALAGGLRALLDARRFHQEVRVRRRLRHEGEAAIGIGGDDHRDRHARLQLLGLRVERLAELHDVEAALAERRTDRRRWIRLARRHLQLDEPNNLLRHRLRPQTFSTCVYSSSTGVARPKIDTATLSRAFSSSTSSTRPLNEVNGPSQTRTCSPISKVIDGFGRSMPSWTWRMMRVASVSEIGTGRPLPPRNPVTFGVFLTRCQVSSVRSIFTRT